jgi:hypothetical protein
VLTVRGVGPLNSEEGEAGISGQTVNPSTAKEAHGSMCVAATALLALLLFPLRKIACCSSIRSPREAGPILLSQRRSYAVQAPEELPGSHDTPRTILACSGLGPVPAPPTLQYLTRKCAVDRFRLPVAVHYLSLILHCLTAPVVYHRVESQPGTRTWLGAQFSANIALRNEKSNEDGYW